MKHVRIAVFALAFTGFTDVAWGVTKQWTNAGGTGTGLWSDGANWNPAGAPSVGDVVEIGTAPTAGNCLLNVATSVAGVTIANPGTPPTLTVTGAITLSVGGPTNVAAGTTIAATNGATVALAGGGTISGTLSTLTAASKFDITGGILTLASGASVNGSGNFRIAAGHATVPASASITIPNLMMSSSGSTLSGSGTITLTGTITWDGGIIGSSSAIYQGGTVIVDSAAIMTLTGAAYYAYVYDNHTLINNGTINYQPPVPYNLYIQPNATLNNAGTFNYATALDIGGSATSAIVNSGLFQKTTAGAPKLYPPFLNNGGTLSAASGSFLLMNGGSASSGYTFTTGPGTSIEFSGGIYTLNNAGSFGGPGNFAINSGHLTAPAAVSVSIPNLTLGTSSSVLSGAGTFTLTGLSTWAGGNIGSTNPLYQGGTVIVGAGSTLNITHSNYYTTLVDTHTLTNNSVINYSSTGSFYLTVQNGATLNNAGVFDYQTDVDIQGSGTAQILNTGTFQKTAGTGLSLLYPRFDNTGGTASANTGQLGFQGGGTASGAYTFNAGASASVDFRGTLYTLSGAGTFNGPGQFRIDGGHLTVPGASVTIPNLVMLTTNSYLSGGGTVTLTGAPVWSAGSMGHSSYPGGTTVVDSGVTMALTDNSFKYLDAGRTLTNNGTITYSAPSCCSYLSLYNSSTLNNAGIFDIQSDNGFGNSGTGNVFNNSGTLKKTAGTSNSGLPFAVNNSGTIEVFTGSIVLSGGGTASGAFVFATASGANLDFASTYTAASSGSFQGLGAGTGSYRLANSANLIVPAAVSVTIPNIYLMTGNSYVSGAGTVVLTGSPIWAAGTMGHSSNPGGTTIVDTGVTLNIIDGSFKYLDQGRTLTNNGTINYNVPSCCSYLSFYNSSTVNNNGLFDIVADNGFVGSGAGNVFNNNGTLRKSGGTGGSGIPLPVNNSNLVEATAGRLELNGGGTHTGTFTATTPGEIAFNGGTHSASATTSFGGTGTIGFLSGTVSIAGSYSPASTRITAGTAVFNSAASTTTLNMSGGVLGGAGIFTVNGASTWSGGTMDGSGTTVIVAAVNVSLPDGTYKYLNNGRTLTNNGTLTYSATTCCSYLSMYAGSTLNNAGTFDFQTDHGIFPSGAGNTVNNTGTMQKTAGTGVSGVGVIVNNDGFIESTSGTLSLNGGGAHTGTFLGTSPGTVAFNGGTHNATAASAFGGSGTIAFFAGSVTVAGSFAPATTKITNGTAILNTTASTTNLDMTNGVLGGTGTFTINGAGTWAGGTMDGTGTTIVNNLVTLSMPEGTYKYLNNGRTLTNNGTIVYSATSCCSYFSMYNASTLNNTGLFDVQTDHGIFPAGPGNTFNNTGTLQKSAGTGTSSFGPIVNNSATVQTATGTLAFTGGGNHTGTFTAISPGVIAFNGGTHTSTAAATFGGNGTIGIFSGTLSVAGTFNPSATRITSGTATFSVPASTTTLDMSGGVLGGTGTFTINGASTWSGGTMDGAGTTVIASGVAVSMPEGTYKYLNNGRTLTNNGTISYTTTSCCAYFSMYNGSTLNNIGVFDVQTDHGILASGGANTFNNSGTLQKTSGTGTSAFGPIINNSANVQVTTGTLSLNGGGTHTGNFDAVSPGAIAFNGGTHAAPNANFGSTGTIRVQSGSVTITGAYAPATTQITGGNAIFNGPATTTVLNMSGGTLGGTGTIAVSGASTWSGGTMSGAGTTHFTSASALSMPDGTYKYLDNARTLINEGTISYAPTTCCSDFGFYNGSTLTNAGTFDIQTDRGMFVSGAGNTFSNSGSFQKSAAAGTSTIGVPFANSGMVTALAGGLAFNGGYTQTAGSLTLNGGAVSSTAPIAIQGGVVSGNGTITANVSNAGTFRPGLSPGTLTITGNYSQTAVGILETEIASAGSADLLAVSGTATLNGTLNVLNIGGYTPANGAGFQIVTYASRSGDFATKNGLSYTGGAYTYNLNATDITLTAGSTADVTVSKTAPATVAINQTFDYTIVVSNLSSIDAATDVTLTDNLSAAGVVLNSITPAAGWTCAGTTTVTCTTTLLGAGSSASFTFNVTAPGSGGSITNTASVASVNEPATNNTNNSSAAATNVVAIEADVSVTVTSPASTTAGNPITYAVSVNNAGPVAATNVVVTASIPPGVTGASYTTAPAASCTLSGATVTCTFASIAASSSATVTISTTAADGGSMTLSATASAAESDPNTANNSGSSTTTVTGSSTLVVRVTADGGNSSLRQALIDLQNGLCVAPCTITFAIPGAGPHTIALLSQLPTGTVSGVTIDGATQPGYAGTPLVRIDGSALSPGASGFYVLGGGWTVRAIALYSVPGYGMFFSGGSGHTVVDNYVGTNGSSDLGNLYDGLLFGNGSGSNVISGNVISGNTGGLRIFGASSGNLITANIIGVAADGSTPLPNSNYGLSFQTGATATVGGLTPADANIIASNGGDGVVIESGISGVEILGNSFSANGDLAIDDGAGAGAPPTPSIASAELSGGNLHVTLSSDATSVGGTTALRIELYHADSLGSAEGSQLVASVCSSGNLLSNAVFTVPAGSTVPGTPIVATATPYSGPSCSGITANTSEFSNAVAAAACTPPAVSIAASGPTTFCAPGTVTLTANPGGLTYLWSTGATTQSITVSATGNYTVTATNSLGCAASASQSVTVNPVPPTPVITASGPTTFCSGGSVTLTAPASASYLWSNGATTQSITVSAAGSYDVTVTNAGGCSSSPSAPVSVTVNPTPPTPTITGPTTFCQGGSVTLTASAGSSWLWSNGATTQSITVSAAGSYSVTVTDGNGCAATSTPTTVSMSPSPAATVTASGPTTFCPGGSVVLTASSGASWLWSTGETTQSITVSASGNYSVTVTGSNACSATSSPVAVAVTPPPATPVITASGPTTFCAGGSVTLTAPASASYLWSNGATTQSITVSATGSYDVTVTNAGGCSSSPSAPVSVTVNPAPPAPTITASGPTTFCQGGSVTLTASNGSSWLWSNGATTQSITVSSGGNYSVTVADGNGCTSTSAPTPITVTSPPIVRISGPSSLCGTGSATLTVEGPGISSVTWSTGATSTSITVAPTSTTTYSALVVTGSCTTTVSHTITVANAGPPLSINAPPSVPALSTGNVASVPGGTTESYSWSIFNGTITSGQGTPSIVFTAGASGAVTLNVTMDSAGCPSNGTTTIAIEPCATVAPSLISPAAGMPSAQSPVRFEWSAVPGAIDYEVWRVVGGSSPSLIGTTSSTSLTADVPSGTYGWYVTARLQQSCDPQRLTSAEVRAITVVPATNCPTLAPALVGPGNGTTPFSPVLFDWTGVPDAIGYRVMVSLGGLPPIELDSTDGDTTDLIAEVPVGAVSWWVEAIYPGCPPIASAIGEFRVELEDCAKHEQARLIAPVNNAVADSSAVTFSWGAVDGADGYAVWAVLDDGPSKIGETLGATSLTAVVPFGRREWYVETLFEGCPSTESDHRFVVVPASANCSSAAPDLLAPAAVTVSSPHVTFTWSSVSGAVLYELWLSVGGGAESLVGRTTSTSITTEVPAGAITWFVRARLNGCPHVDSQRRELRYEPPTGCSTMVPMPLLPMDDGRPITSPVAFRWTAVPGAAQYKLYLGRGANGVFELKATTSAPEANGIAVSNGESRWFVEAIFNGCPSTRSSNSRFVAVPIPTSCIDLAAPVISLPGQVSAGTPYTVQWTAVPGAESYLLTEFIGSTARTITITGQSAQFIYNNPSSDGHMYVYRVRGVDHDCDPPREGALSTELGISILPERSSEASALVGSQSTVQHTITIGADRAGQTFVASAIQPWITVAPSTGVVPAGGINLIATADVTGLPLGTSIGTVSIAFGGGAGSRQATTATGPVTTPISVSLVTPVTPTPKSTPPPDALIIPAVAHADGINAQFRSDVRVSNTSPQVMKYQLTFIPSGEAGITQGRQTTLDIEPGRTIALDDVLRSWFGTGDSSILGTLEIRPVTQSSSSTSSAATRGVPNFVTFASSRTFNQTPNGTFGTYIAAIPFANFIGRSTDSSKSVLSMQQIAQSSVYRSNLGFVEGSGNPAELLVSVFASSGAKITDFPVSLTGGQHLQMNSFLADRGIQLDDGRLEVQVTSGTGRVTSYASVVNNATGDSLVVTPTTLGQTTSSKYVLPGVAELSGGVVWQTDMRLFNAGAQPVTATLTLQSLNGSPQQQASVQLAAGEVKQLDRVLATLFGVANDGGAVHITTESESKLIATARTFRPAGDGANFGQFIQAVTPDQAIALGSRPLQLLQVEESPRFRSNVGIAEVSGRSAKVELTVIPPDAKVSAKIEVDLAANQFRQLNSLLSAMGLEGTHNARVTVKVIGGQGRVTAYAATIDALTQDPTFIPAQ